MYLPPLQPVVNLESYLYGDVNIHPKAAIASGVILQASPDSRIVIEEEVCLGMGVIIHAYDGEITIKKGAILGAGVLIMGAATVGANSCVGASSTLINTDLKPQTAIAPGSLLGDTSRQINLSAEEETVNGGDWTQVEQFSEPDEDRKETVEETSGLVSAAEELIPSPWDLPDEQEEEIKEQIVEEIAQQLAGEFVTGENKETQSEVQPSEEPKIEPSNSIKPQNPSTVVGKMYVNQLLVTLFPQNQKSTNNKLSS